jgi:hypothetical protein
LLFGGFGAELFASELISFINLVFNNQGEKVGDEFGDSLGKGKDTNREECPNDDGDANNSGDAIPR